ncbi:chemotaxis protein CheX [Alicyclobacillus fastidiosus]|uniref:Chemotaxis protein CheX n=1 Tax=Alicyclobacillus fastidiosus TaxID=392011 RepID=A0ABY6ZF71_9BACL|nr:chemotaxis protein CheX [Alicyclobacillus fastidiosus]WAH41487.1 chemotaxis protein CheX [Alicyclobacillus fastidiosus]GMA63132.1 CheY-P phosphatase CheX [Alicyclobacillus fastidiosus]
MSTDFLSPMTEMVEGVGNALKSVLPVPIALGDASVVDGAIYQPEMGVLVGVTGGFRGRIIIQASQAVFSAFAVNMYGMALEGDMLESFVGELGNMIAGSTCTTIATKGMVLDITPPTVLVGNTKLSGFQHALQVSVEVDGVGDMQVLLILEENLQ